MFHADSVAATASASRPEQPPGLDPAGLLDPLPTGNGAGEAVRYAGDYDRIEEARRHDDPNLPQGVWQRDLKRADWDQVIALCAQTLRLRSKDLQVACWLVEALVHRHGFAGLAWGLDLLAGLCTTFWPDLYPAIEEDDNSARLAPLEWLNGKLPPSLKQLPLTRGGSGGTSPALGWDAYLNARRLESARQRDPKLIAEGGLAAFDDAAAATPTPFYQTLHRNLRGATQARQRLQDILDERCGRLAPSLAGLADATAEIANWVEIVLMQRHALPAEPPSQWPAEATVPGDEDYPDLAAGISAPAAGPITGRDEAYARLAEIADYLQRTEPHSPAPYLLRRILAWARMPLSELLVDMARGQKDLQAVLDLLGDGRRG